MASTAASLRSVLKTLNSVSSAVNAAPVSSVTAVSPLAAVAASASCGERRFVAGHQRVHGLLQQFAIVREIRDHLQRVAERHHAHQVRRSHLLAQYISRPRASSAADPPACSEVMSKNSTIMR